MNNKQHTAADRTGVLGAFAGFFRIESSSGILLIAVSVIAVIIANSPASGVYEKILSYPLFLEVHHKTFTLLDWINEGLMAIFFLSVGLEIKREIASGELSTRAKASLPLIAAFGGMLIPALIYSSFNNGMATSKGWGIPMATDIAFSLGVITLLGKRIPTGIRIFIVALAIADDIGAILVIAFFYAQNIDFLFLLLVLAIMLVLFFLRKKRNISPAVFYVLGGVLWFALLGSGVHPSISGVALGFLLPGTVATRNFEDRLGRMTAFFIMPVFAFANAGLRIDVSNFGALLSENVSLGIFFGLLAGKTIGIFSFSFLATKLRIAALPSELGWDHIFGASLVCAIGFTMSLFIAGIAFGPADEGFSHAKFAIIAASLVAGIGGYCFLRFVSNGKNEGEALR